LIFKENFEIYDILFGMNKSLITLQNCRIEDSKSIQVKKISWEMKTGEAWLITGSNGGGKAAFVKALSGMYNFVPNISNVGENETGLYSSVFEKSVEVVSLERAATIIEEERINDESDYIEGGVDIGRTGRVFLCEALENVKVKKNAPLPEIAHKLEGFPQVKLCGIDKILDRGLKYMSTGEIRRTLLCRALLANKKLLVLSDPFAGLDAESRKILLEFFNTITTKQLNETDDNLASPRIVLCMERFHEIPDAINKVLEFQNGEVSFCGNRSEYEKILEERKSSGKEDREEAKAAFEKEVSTTEKTPSNVDEKIPLIEMNHINVGWDEHKVLIDLTWALYKGEHYLIRGPNGSGKTTLLELITGDNGQVFCNDVRLFGKKRGTGETIWDIKKQLGIVSYRLHVEYRMVSSTTLRDVIISGYRDSIGLYEVAGDVEKASAMRWLALGGFKGRENESFGSLSYGEQRAILILRAAVKNPAILILDEPCHGLDEQFRQKILDLLEVVAESGTTTLLHVTHDPTEVLPAEKHILELYKDSEPMYKIINLS
jgi:molybdate transport system ATP-binding protein